MPNLDRFAAAGRIALYAAWCVVLGVSAASCDSRDGESTSNAHSTNSIPRYELIIAPKDLRELERNIDGDRLRPATFTAKGKEYDVKVRLRGSWARSWPKKSFKIFFEKGREFEDNECLNLNTGWRDPAFVREPLAYHIYTACGVPASKAQMVELHVNGTFHGLYVEVEQPEKPFLKRHRLAGAALYKANSDQNRADERDLGSEQAFMGHYEKETRKKDGWRDLQTFCQELAAANNDVPAFFDKNVDVARYIDFLAASALVQNWDCLNKNHFLVHDLHGSGKWQVVPWDLDRTLGDHWQGGFNSAEVPLLLGKRQLPGPTGWNRLADAFFSDKTLRQRYLDRLEALLEKEFTIEKLFPLVDQFEAAIGPLAMQDRKRWPSDAGAIHRGIQELKDFIPRRRTFLLREIARLRQQN
ncbi:MAG TPA: CotH kinase family protein [Blastocatellia bacterium]|nr:CotH kinase family protein [Blastocatellia bacterium]